MNDIEMEMIEVGAEVYNNYGIDDLSATILSILFFEPGEMTMEELAEFTGYSLASISLKMKGLEYFWGVHRIKKSGSRKIYFHMGKSYLDRLEETLRRGHEMESHPVKRSMPGLIWKYREQATSESQVERLHLVEKDCRQIDDVGRILETLYEMIDEARSEQKDNGTLEKEGSQED